MPRDASKDFGEMFIEGVLPALINHDNDGVLAKGSITVNGKISDKYNYLSDWVED
jgi:hypothetical protein